ncbi:MAG: capsular polysaccharide biosynthesis protein [Henriciella sp.]
MKKTAANMSLNAPMTLMSRKALATIRQSHLWPGDLRYSLSGRRIRSGMIGGWGRKATALKAKQVAASCGLPFICIEDGFLRSNHKSAQPVSLIFDRQGIYFDSTAPSDIEDQIRAPLSSSEYDRAVSVIKQWRDAGVSKYNYLPDYAVKIEQKYVLVADQIAGDASLRYGQASPDSFNQMLEQALSENPDHLIVIKTHPDKFLGSDRGMIDLSKVSSDPRVLCIDAACHPVELIRRADKVYTATSQIGFEALIWQRPVKCYGMPFYAGWGLTEDVHSRPRRRTDVTLEQLVHGALIKYPSYVDPESQQRVSVEQAIRNIQHQRSLMLEFPETLYAIGFSRWKQPILKRFLSGSQIKFIRSAKSAPPQSTLVVWGDNRVKPIGPEQKILRVEDGFLRSVGLGAALTQPCSWAIDDLGMYYDSRTPSRLETILSEIKLDPDEIRRAEDLQQQIVNQRISKYNLAGHSWSRPANKKHVLLVPGQVETDASIRLGSPHIKNNLDLLRAVRKAQPGSYIIYKPHPDIVSGLRASALSRAEIMQYADEIVDKVDTADLFGQIDEVHTMTSLMGFEAILRNLPVTCYGHPFYAGWGLTIDIYKHERRNRKLSIGELVWGALIAYPRYRIEKQDRFATPEIIVNKLQELKHSVSTFDKIRSQILQRILATGLKIGIGKR